ncbi:MAG: Ig-like domain-containing protein, partial [Phycisphaerae bacterium]|nr:Ig-like domain-containing protein [Gemmatimonadaceae bacterium]
MPQTSRYHAIMRYLPIMVGSLLIASCTEPSGPDPVVPELTTVTVALSAPAVPVGGSVVATAAGIDQNGASIATGNVVWTSTSAASVDATGRVTGISAGQATITANASGKTGQATILVTALPATALKFLTSPSTSSPNRARFSQ